MSIDFSRMRRTNRKRLEEELLRVGGDGLILLGPSNQEYAGIRRPCADAMRLYYEPVVVLIVPGKETHVWTPFPGGVDEEIGREYVHPEFDLEFPEGVDALKAALGDLIGQKARVAIDELTAPLLEQLIEVPSHFAWFDAGPVTRAARLCKTPEEIACLRHAQGINERAIVDVREALRPGVRQEELSAILLRRAFELGATANCVDPIWNITPRDRKDQSPTLTGSLGFPIASRDKIVHEDDLIICDTGLVWNGYHSDFGATWLCTDAPRPDAGLRDCYRRWRAVMECVYESVRPGRSCRDIVHDVASLEAHYKVDHFYLAHGIGCDAAEGPFVGTDMPPEVEAATELREGMTIVFEPLIWEDGVGGYRSEELVLVTDSGCERLSRHGYAPFE